MTPAQGYEYAKKQTPGVVVSMGPTCAKIVKIKPIGYFEWRKLPDLPDRYKEDKP